MSPLSPEPVSPDAMSNLLASIRNAFPHVSFMSGDCHTLAKALHRVFGFKGGLCACIREGLDDSGGVFETTYMHMVYDDGEGGLWDIDGPNADLRYDLDHPDQPEPDKWGLTYRHTWVDVPATGPHLTDTNIWLQENFGAIDMPLESRIAAVARAALAAAEVELSKPAVETRRPTMCA